MYTVQCAEYCILYKRVFKKVFKEKSFWNPFCLFKYLGRIPREFISRSSTEYGVLRFGNDIQDLTHLGSWVASMRFLLKLSPIKTVGLDQICNLLC